MSIKIKIKIPTMPILDSLNSYAGKEIEVTVNTIETPDMILHYLQNMDSDLQLIEEKSNPQQVGLPSVLGQELKTLNVEFK